MNRPGRSACGLAIVMALTACGTTGSDATAATAAPKPLAAAEAAALFDTLVAIERRSWNAWQGHDGAFFREVLADDHLDVGFSGPVDKQAVVAGVLSPACVVKSFAVEGFRLLSVDATTALLTYRAKQDTSCGGFAVPSPTWVSSLYVKRGGRWQNLIFQQTPAQP